MNSPQTYRYVKNCLQYKEMSVFVNILQNITEKQKSDTARFKKLSEEKENKSENLKVIKTNSYNFPQMFKANI